MTFCGAGKFIHQGVLKIGRNVGDNKVEQVGHIYGLFQREDSCLRIESLA